MSQSSRRITICPLSGERSTELIETYSDTTEPVPDDNEIPLGWSLFEIIEHTHNPDYVRYQNERAGLLDNALATFRADTSADKPTESEFLRMAEQSIDAQIEAPAEYVLRTRSIGPLHPKGMAVAERVLRETGVLPTLPALEVSA